MKYLAALLMGLVYPVSVFLLLTVIPGRLQGEAAFLFFVAWLAASVFLNRKATEGSKSAVIFGSVIGVVGYIVVVIPWFVR